MSRKRRFSGQSPVSHTASHGQSIGHAKRRAQVRRTTLYPRIWGTYSDRIVGYPKLSPRNGDCGKWPCIRFGSAGPVPQCTRTRPFGINIGSVRQAVLPRLSKQRHLKGMSATVPRRYASFVRFSISKPLVWLGIAVLGYFACTTLMWSTVYTSQSPDGKYTIIVQDGIHIGPDSPVRIILKRGLWSRTLASQSDCWFSFAHAIWQDPTRGRCC